MQWFQMWVFITEHYCAEMGVCTWTISWSVCFCLNSIVQQFQKCMFVIEHCVVQWFLKWIFILEHCCAVISEVFIFEHCCAMISEVCVCNWTLCFAVVLEVGVWNWTLSVQLFQRQMSVIIVQWFLKEMLVIEESVYSDFKRSL